MYGWVAQIIQAKFRMSSTALKALRHCAEIGVERAVYDVQIDKFITSDAENGHDLSLCISPTHHPSSLHCNFVAFMHNGAMGVLKAFQYN